ncbi:MAG: tetratricopeptide repeat protein [Acidobacteriota bacterium]
MPASLRLVVVTLALAVASATALAETDVVLLGPAVQGKVSAAHVNLVRKLVDKAAIAPPTTRALDAACAADVTCLVKAGNDMTAKRVVALTLAEPGRGQVVVSVALVDVIGNEMVAVRDLQFTDRTLVKELAPALKKFLDEAPTDRAKALFAEGNQHFNLGEMAPALELYKRAYRIKPLPAFLFNIAQCQRKLGHYQEAITMYQSYLTGVPDAQNKATIESLIAESKQALADQQKRDQDKAALAATVEAERLETEKKKAEEARKAKEAEARAAAERRKADEERMAHEKEVYDHHPMRKWMIVTSILAAGALGTGGYFGVQARKQQQNFDTTGCGDTTYLGADQIAACVNDRKTGQHDALLANSFLIGGGAALLGSIIVFAIDPGNVSRPETPRAQLKLAPTSVQVVLTW